ncbi:MAG: DUF72 domain-containing protein [Candidatus Glassbacteria bacterium]
MILIGTSGYYYDDWKGVFYPPGLAKRDFLAYYSSRFPALELNSSYYAVPSGSLVRALALNTPAGFQVVVKAYKGITHERAVSAGEIQKGFLQAIEPLAAAGKLAAVLYQFPQSFRYGSASLELVGRILDGGGDLPAVVEFRHASWMNEQAWVFLRCYEAGFCSVDEPALPGLMPPEAVCTSGRIGYLRFHGRNAQKWWNHREAWERYDYLYPDEELAGWLKNIRWLEDHTDKTFIFFNNHRSGQAAQNAGMMEEMLGIEPPPGIDDQQKLL